MLPYSEDLDAQKIHVHVPTHVIFLCGGPISNISEKIPKSLRDAFYKILDNPVLKTRELLLAEDVTTRFDALNNYRNILELETDLAQIVELIVLFCESEGSLAELGAFAATNEIAKRLFVIVREKHWEQPSFIKLGPLRLIETEYGRDSIYVIDGEDVGMQGESASTVNLETLKNRLTDPLTVRLRKSREPTTFDPSRSGHVIKLVVALIQEYGALQVTEISSLLQFLNVSGTTEEKIKGYLFCAENVGWLKKVAKGSVDYFVAKAAEDAANIHAKPSAKERNRTRRRLLIREYWKKHDEQRFRAISETIGNAGS